VDLFRRQELENPHGTLATRTASDRSCRREILDYVIALNEEHLRRILWDYVNYHHEDRLHDSLEKDTP
jgi:hypothetical protein